MLRDRWDVARAAAAVKVEEEAAQADGEERERLEALAALIRGMFLRDMRMTRTEQKREHKDNEGDPLLRGERRRLFAEMLQQAASFGIRKASVAVVDGDRIVGLRYVRGETALPMVVAKARGAAGFRMIERARRDGIPVVHDRELAAALSSRHALGKPVEHTEVYSAYREANGLKYPTKTLVKQNGKRYLESETAEFKPLEKVDPREFALSQ